VGPRLRDCDLESCETFSWLGCGIELDGPSIGEETWGQWNMEVRGLVASLRGPPPPKVA